MPTRTRPWRRCAATARRASAAPRSSSRKARCGSGACGARSALDLQRDPRFALHSGSGDPPDWTADAKVAGRAEEVTEPQASSHRFRLQVTELVVTSIGDPPDHIVIESWHEGRGVSRLTRT
jgi:hypothetical protein